MKYTLVIFSISILQLLSLKLSAQVTIVKGGKSDYHITIAANANALQKHAAQVLKNNILKISGCSLPVNTDNKVYDKEILIGKTSHTKSVPYNKIEDDGFVIKTDKNQLIITGKNEEGTLNGVYSFLEDYLGCEYYSSQVIKIPKEKNITIDDIDIVNNPAFAFRDVYYHDAYDKNYMEWNKISHAIATSDIASKNWGLFGHTFFTLMPPSKYFAKHPEYYSLVNGKRQPDQLCLSNAQMRNELIKNLKILIQKYPDKDYWMISAEDNLHYCTDAGCKKLYQQYGGVSGAMMNFVNNIAAHFPNKKIFYLAYNKTRQLPKNIKPAKNVWIFYTDIDADRSRPINQNPRDKAILANLNQWFALCDKRLFLWDYVINYQQVLAPYPIFFTLQPNLQYFNKIGCKGIFEQGLYWRGGEFNELKCYLLAKLLWNPNINIDHTVNDFLNGYYGKAAPYIKTYLYDLNNNFKQAKSNPVLSINIHIYNYRNWILNPQQVKAYDSLMDKAEAAVTGSANRFTYLNRIRLVRMQIDYAVLQITMQQPNYYGKLDKDHIQDLAGRLQRLEKTIKSNTIINISERAIPTNGKYDTEIFLQNMHKLISKWQKDAK